MPQSWNLYKRPEFSSNRLFSRKPKYMPKYFKAKLYEFYSLYQMAGIEVKSTLKEKLWVRIGQLFLRRKIYDYLRCSWNQNQHHTQLKFWVDLEVFNVCKVVFKLG